MAQNKISILAVDDEELNLDIMKECFEDTNCNYITASDGVEALKILEAGTKIDVILLDRMMPNMNGMEFLHLLKNSKKYNSIPIIMQTAATSSQQIAEGIESGVFYYLGKPYSKEVLLALVRAANDDKWGRTEIKRQMRKHTSAMRLVQQASFKFKTIKDVEALAMLISSCLDDPESKLIGLIELMVNSVEHGNLGITYEEKKELKLSDRWDAEIVRRAALPENRDKYCDLKIIFNEQAGEYIINVKDKGIGFDWEKFSQIDPVRLTDPNGRGIIISQNSGFEQICYIGNGNEFECRAKAKTKLDN
jgi:CheY-like chemotaxis protein